MLHYLRRALARIRNRRFDEDLAEELRFHEEMKQRELHDGGLDPETARIAARRAIGNVTLAREDARRVWIAPWAESVAQDVRYAVRTLGRQPAHSLTVGLTLALGFGLSTSLFSVFKGAAMDPWPAKNPRELVRIVVASDKGAVGPSIDEYRFMRDNARSFNGLAAHSWAGNGARLRAEGRPEQYLRAVWTSSNFFDVLGVPTALGRTFVREDDVPGNRRAPLVISATAWKAYFASDPSVVGTPVFVGGVPFTIVGVLDRSFDGIGRPVDLWMPLASMSMVRPSDVAWEPSPRSAVCCIGMAARLAPGVSARQARDELQLLHERFARSVNGTVGRVEVRDTSPLAGRTGAQFAIVGIFAVAVALILVLACANVGNVQLARGLARHREIATRLSIGASRGRVVRQLVTEALVLAVAAGAAALALAVALPPLLFRYVGEQLPPHMETRMLPDAGVVLFTLALCVVACLFSALVPAVHATRAAIPLRSLDRHATGDARFRLRGALLAVQVAACTVLLVAAGLLTRSIGHAMSVDPGFRVDAVSLVTVGLPDEGYTTEQRRAFSAQVLKTLERAGGPEVAVSTYAPLDGSRLVMRMTRPGESLAEPRTVGLRQVSRDYFNVLGIPLVEGRPFDSASSNEAIVNEAFAHAYFPGRDPLGQVVHDVEPGIRIRRSYTVVGVARDVYQTSLERIDPLIFTPATSGLFLASGGAAGVERVRAAAVEANTAAVVTARPGTDSLRDYLKDSRTAATIAWALGLLGLVLAAVGVFGVFAYAVEERRREIGVRLALGAERRDVVRLLVSTSGRAMLAGLAAGLVLSLACGPVLRSHLYGLSPVDPGAYGVVVIVLTVASVLATVIPARRACAVDPAVTLRAD